MRHVPAGDVRPVVGRVGGFIIVSEVELGLEVFPRGSSSMTGPLLASAGTTTSIREDCFLIGRTLRPPPNWTLSTPVRRRPRTRIVEPELTGSAFALAVEALPLGQP